jgi:hypothetical protein
MTMIKKKINSHFIHRYKRLETNLEYLDHKERDSTK